MMNHRPVPDLLLEQYLLGELPKEKAEALAGLLAGDEALEARLEALRHDDEAILVSYPPRVIVHKIQERTENARGNFPGGQRMARMAFVSLSLVLISVVGAWYFSRSSDGTQEPRFTPGNPGTVVGTTRIKGSDSLMVFLKTSGSAVRLHDRQAVSAGDVIELQYRSPLKHGVVLSVDGRGAVTLHFPRSPKQSTSLAQRPAPRAYELDDAPRFERFIFITSHGPLPVEALLKRARKAGDLMSGDPLFGDLPGVEGEVSVLLMKKQEPTND
ncbi:hypothetical protein KKF84_06075 [Myxococcota bacterium]|nr:hypothetical protein [Myxococcota bacterium]MBU1534866.1 hypothetical protein [Myxococcota bacterium]